MLSRSITLLALLGVTVLSSGNAVAQGEPKSNQFWWPDSIDLSPLRDHSDASNPMGDDFNYAEEFAKVDLDALKTDIEFVLTDSQAWWPADWG
ncbi:MAG: catalase-peroxidase, partial [Pseudomonadota bacterium]